MAELKFIIRNTTLTDGQHRIALRITKNRKSKIISMNFRCKKSEWDTISCQFKKNYKNHVQSNMTLLKLKEKGLKVINDFCLEGIDFSLSQFEEKFRDKEPSRVTVFEFWDELISDLQKSKKEGHVKTLKETKNSFFKFCNNKKIMFKEINSALLDKYEVFLRENNNANGGVAFKMRELRVVFNKAIKKGIVSDKYYPFSSYKISKLKSKTIKVVLTREEVKLIQDLDESVYPHLAEAKRMFMFSYYCRGINFIDMALLKWSNISGLKMHYIRSKTKGVFNFDLLEPAIKILDFYRNSNPETDYVFPILLSANMTAKQIHIRKHQKAKKTNSDLKKITKVLGINKEITFYTARHCFATNLKLLGTSTDKISQSMGHSNLQVTAAYLKEFDDEDIDKEIKKLLFEDSTNYYTNNKRLAS